MECITSPALNDIQILSYVEGEADDRVVTHIKECQFCSERANRWTRLQTRLRKQLYRVTCPTPIELGDYHLGLLPAPQVLVVAQHVRGCPLCRREVVVEPVVAEHQGRERRSDCRSRGVAERSRADRIVLHDAIEERGRGCSTRGRTLDIGAPPHLVAERQGGKVSLGIRHDGRECRARRIGLRFERGEETVDGVSLVA